MQTKCLASPPKIARRKTVLADIQSHLFALIRRRHTGGGQSLVSRLRTRYTSACLLAEMASHKARALPAESLSLARYRMKFQMQPIGLIPLSDVQIKWCVGPT